jgi:hypothetical protein
MAFLFDFLDTAEGAFQFSDLVIVDMAESR